MGSRPPLTLKLELTICPFSDETIHVTRAPEAKLDSGMQDDLFQNNKGR